MDLLAVTLVLGLFTLLPNRPKRNKVRQNPVSGINSRPW